MILPETLRQEVERALAEQGLGRRIEALRPVGGGCINNGARVETDAAVSLFLKWNPGAPPGMFEAEWDGLRALGAGGPVRVPTPVALSQSTDTPWLLMEYVTPASPGPATESALGRGLAELHRSAGEDTFGWERDNWIGSLEQANTPCKAWGDFWRDRRIGPQLALARRRGRASAVIFEELLELVPLALTDVRKPQLLHGDLWGGNWFAGDGGEPVLIDPAVYRGDGEVDLAMSELFGGFGPAFYAAYEEAHGISEAYHAYKKELYQLYYLLVHVNLFGGAYEVRSVRAAERVLGELR